MEINRYKTSGNTAKVITLVTSLWLSLFAGPLLHALSAAERADSVVSLCDSTTHNLGEVTVTAASAGSTLHTTAEGDVILSASALSTRTRSFGESDIIGALKVLPGVTSIGDYGSGISVDGADISQTAHTINGSPVLFPYRFGGIFSTFNTTHFKDAVFSRICNTPAAPMRLGGRIDLHPHGITARQLEGSVNIGLLSSSATVRLSDTRRWSVTASGRISYIDELYGRFLTTAERNIRYNFHDLNLSAVYVPDSVNTLSADIFNNADHLTFKDGNYAMDLLLDWKNLMTGINWRHKTGATDMSTRLSYTAFDNVLSLRQPQLLIEAPSSLQQISAANDGSRLSGMGLIRWGAEANYYRVQPQWATYCIEGNRTGSRKHIRHMADYKLSAEIKWPVSGRFHISPAVRLSGMYTDGYTKTDVSPLVTLEYTTRRNVFRLRAGRYCQYLHLVGLSEIGLASNFWMIPDHNTPRQSMWDFAVSSRSILPFAGLKLETSLYYKRVLNQPEYFGNVIDIIDISYDASAHLRDFDGYNTGFNIDLRRETGSFTGSLNYSFGIARRKNPATGEWFRAVTETLNSLGVDLSYRLDDRWTFGATFVYSTGRPYTPVRSIYLIGGTIGMEYGKTNSAFFPSYQRLDLSVTYSLTSMYRKSHRLNHLINFSLLNAYGHKNVDMQYFILKLDMDQYRLKRIYSLYQFVPSISYTLQF